MQSSPGTKRIYNSLNYRYLNIYNRQRKQDKECAGRHGRQDDMIRFYPFRTKIPVGHKSERGSHQIKL